MAVLFCAMACSPAAHARSKQSKQEKIDAAHAAEIAAAQTAAEAWLRLEDADKYGDAWKAASGGFQAHVPEAAWERRMDAVRRPLEPVLTRSLSAAEYKTQLPGLPAGEYVALVWETVFASGTPSLESVVMANDGGKWKMAGYAVQ